MAIETIGIVGTGLIGSGWAARCLARGIDVIAFDASLDGEEKFARHVDNAWYALEKLDFSRSNSGSCIFTTDLTELCGRSDYIQESIPESIELKRDLHAEMDAVTSEDVVIASSSSGLLPSEIQAQAMHPDRILIGHPFNPVYILPLVEIVCGELTSRKSAEQAADFYRSIGMHPLMVKKEIHGYVSDRLQEAIWRESLHMVAEGVASTKDIDDAIVYGPGLRWAIMGVCLTFHLAGGEGGMRHMLEQFGPALQLPWTKLRAPELTEELIESMVQGTKEQAGDDSIKDLENLRDDCLIGILQVLKRHGYGAGCTSFEAVVD